MADPIIIIEGSKITELPDGVTPLGDELIELVQNIDGVLTNVKLPLSVVRATNGGLLTANFKFLINTVETQPADGHLKLDNSAANLVTEIYISSLTDLPVSNIDAQLDKLREGDSIRLQLASDPTNYITYRLTGIGVNNTNWWSLPVEYNSSNGSLFGNEVPINVVFIFNEGGGSPSTSQNLDDVLTVGNNAGAKQIKNLADPTLAQDAATKAYVDNLEQHFRGTYISLAALQAAVPIGDDGDYAFVDAGAGNDPNLYVWDSSDASWKLGGSAPPVDASESLKGVVEEGTDGEVQAGTATGGTGARLFVNPAKLATWWTWIKTQAQTFAAQITFTLAPRFNSTTANQFLKVDSNKDLTSVAPATQAEMITGTDDTKPATPLAVEKKRSVKLISFSNNATGSSTIDCDNKQEVTVVYTTTVTGAITIAVSNASNLELLNVIIPITGSNIAITTPSTTRMARYNEVSSGDGWYQSTKILQVSSVGTADVHELSFKRASTGPIFLLRYDGPARA